MQLQIGTRRAMLAMAGLSAALTLGATFRLWRESGDVHGTLTRLVLPALVLAAGYAALAGQTGNRPLRPPDPGEPAGPPDPSPVRGRALLLLGLVVAGAGAFLRVEGSSEFPPSEGIGYEELQIGCMGWDILVHREQPDEHRFPAWLNAVSFTLREPGIESMRLPFILLSALSPLFLLLAARRVASPEVAILVTGFWSVAWWPILAGRIADEIYSVAPLQVLALALLFRAHDGRRPLAAWGAGLLCGIFLTEYTAYHAFPLLVLAAVAAATLRAAWRARSLHPELSPRAALASVVSPHRLAITGFLLAFLALALPVLSAAVRLKSRYFFEGVVRHGSSPDAIYRKPLPEYAGIVKARIVNLWRAAHVDGAGEEAPWLNPNRGAMLDRATFGFLVTGLALLLLTPFRRRHGLLLAVVFVPGAVFLAVPGNEDFIRYFVVLPLAFLGAAAGMQVAWSALPRAGRAVLLLAGTAVLLHAAVVNGQRVREVSRSPAVRHAYLDPDAVLARFIGSLEKGSRTVVLYDQQSGSYPNVELLTWLLHGRSARVATSLADALLEPPPRDAPLRFVVFPVPSQPGLGSLLNHYVGPSRLETTLRAFYHDEPLEVWRIDPLPEAPLVHRAGGVQVRTWAGPADADPDGPLPAGAEALSIERQPAFSSLAFPTELKMQQVFSPRADGRRLWVSMEGVPEPPESRHLRLDVRGGVAWLYYGGVQVLQVEAGPWEAGETRLIPAPHGRALRLVYRFDGPDWPGIQLSWVDSSGQRSLVAAPGEERFIYLTELPRSEGRWPLGSPVTNLSGRGAPIQVNGLRFAYGLGFHAPGRVSWDVPPGAERLAGQVGLQDLAECTDPWQATVRVFLDAKSEPAVEVVLKGKGGLTPLDVPLQGARRLTIEIGEGDDGVNCDHVNLVEGRFVFGR